MCPGTGLPGLSVSAYRLCRCCQTFPQVAVPTGTPHPPTRLLAFRTCGNDTGGRTTCTRKEPQSFRALRLRAVSDLQAARDTECAGMPSLSGPPPPPTPDSRALSRGPYAGIPRRPWRQPLPSARWGPAGTALLGATCGPPPTAPRDRAGRHRSRIRAWGGAVAGWGERPSGPPGGRPSPACAAARGQHSPADGLPARQAGAGRGAERLGPGEAGPGFLAVTTPHSLWVYGEAYF